jgi:hypothetical protein
VIHEEVVIRCTILSSHPMNFGQLLEKIAVEHLGPIGLDKSFDKIVLAGLSEIDEL